MDTDRRLKLLSFLSSNMVVVTETGDMVNAVLDNNDFKDFEKSVVPAILPEDIVNLL